MSSPTGNPYGSGPGNGNGGSQPPQRPGPAQGPGPNQQSGQPRPGTPQRPANPYAPPAPGAAPTPGAAHGSVPGSVPGSRPQAAPGFDPYAQADLGNSNKKTIAWAIGGIVAALILGAVIGARLLSSTSTAPKQEILTRNDKAPAPVLQQESKAPAPTMAQTRKTMPADVRAWLEHLEKIEARRVDLTLKQKADFMVQLAAFQGGGADLDALKGMINSANDIDAPEPKNPAENFGALVEQKKKDWMDLVASYEAVRAPAVCVTAATLYDHALKDTATRMVDVFTLLENMSNDPQGALASAYAMQKKSTTIDKAGGDTDREVGKICDLYDTRKWFSIAEDIGGGDMFSKPTGGGMGVGGGF